MSWDVDLVVVTRIIIDDAIGTQKYSDDYLKKVLVAAGILVNSEINLANDYTFDISAVTINPDPITKKDSVAQALFTLKAACMLTQGEFRSALGQGIRVRDGDSAVDTSVSFRGYRDILELGPCASFEKIKKQAMHSQDDMASISDFGAVLSPNRGPNEQALHTITWFFNSIANAIGYNCRRRR